VEKPMRAKPMLEEKLRQASVASSKGRKRMFLMLFIMASFCIICIVAFSFVNFTASPPSAKAPVAIEITQQEKNPSALRSQFMHQLRTYEEDTEPALAGANLQNWAVDKALAISSLKKDATASFAARDYAAAVKKLSDSESMARQVLAQRNAIFSSQMVLAEKALANYNAIEAKLRITKALLVNPQNKQALDLAKQIDALPKIIALLKKATIAQTENNPEKEYAAITEAYKLYPNKQNPNKQKLKQRADMLAEKIRGSRFSALIARGLANVEKRRIKPARSNYQQAKAIYPERPELRVLNKAIGKLAHGMDLDRAITQGKASIARDDWIKARSIYTAAAKKHPDNKTILDGLQLSDRIVSLQSELAAHIRHSLRLSSPNVSAAAQDLLIQAKVFSRNSATLSRQTSELYGLIANMNKKISVTVKSDNQTFILVRGVGKVGITQQRTIQLKPGVYTFEGIRKGYISKLVEVRIPIGTRSLGVEIVCDERI